MYDRAQSHFGTRVYGRVYDITGDVTEKFQWELWERINDSALKDKVTKEYIMF